MLEGSLSDYVDDMGHQYCHGSGLHVRMVVPPMCCAAVVVRYHFFFASGPVVVLMSGLMIMTLGAFRNLVGVANVLVQICHSTV